MQNAIEKDQADNEGRYIDNPQVGRYVQEAEIIEQSEPTDAVIEQPITPAPSESPKQMDFKNL